MDDNQGHSDIMAGNSEYYCISYWSQSHETHVLLSIDHTCLLFPQQTQYDIFIWTDLPNIMQTFFVAETKQLYEWYFLSVCPSVSLSHIFDYVPIIVSSWNFQELSHWTRVRSIQKVKVRSQRSRSQRSRPKFSFPDCNSSLNSHVMMKWYI